MKRNIYTIIISAAAVITGMTSCEKESAFIFNEGEGMIDCESMAVEYISGGRQVRSVEDNLSANDFTVSFIDIETQQSVKDYLYTDLPTVVSLPKGKYQIEAHFGDDVVADWDSPYYLGKSNEIVVSPNEISKNSDPITCTLSNIRIGVNFGNLGEVTNPRVVVKAGEANDYASLTYTQKTQEEGKIGYFKAGNSNSITATFYGNIGEDEITVSKGYDNAKAGNAYTINFTVNQPGNNDDGNISIGGTDGGINIDASITIEDQTEVVDPDEKIGEIIEDMYPRPTGESENNETNND